MNFEENGLNLVDSILICIRGWTICMSDYFFLKFFIVYSKCIGNVNIQHCLTWDQKIHVSIVIVTLIGDEWVSMAFNEAAKIINYPIKRDQALVSALTGDMIMYLAYRRFLTYKLTKIFRCRCNVNMDALKLYFLYDNEWINNARISRSK